MFSTLQTLWLTFLHLFHRSETVQYPEQKPYLAPRYRGRIVLTRDPDGAERCVSCYLCAVACPVACISLQKTEEAGAGIRNISASISPAVFSAAFAKRHAPPTRSS